MLPQVANKSLDRPGERSSPLCWHIITSEYPPQAGGVSDYTRGIAMGLAAQGDDIHVWCPGSGGLRREAGGLFVHQELGSFGPGDLRHAGRQLDRFPVPRRIFLQWVPHGYGWRSMNLAFCWWLWNRAAHHGDQLEIMVHEPWLPFRARSWRQSGAALVHRLMIVLLLRRAERVWVATPEWEKRWRPYALRRPIPFRWLPVPSNIPVTANVAECMNLRRRFADDQTFLIGHFGTYGWPITSLLQPIVEALACRSAGEAILLMGPGSKQFRERLLAREPGFAGRIHATDALTPHDLSTHLNVCDLLIQPYPDGVTTRRGSFMAGLAHGRPIVTTTGSLTEPMWTTTGALVLVPAGEVQPFVDAVQSLRANPRQRNEVAQSARRLYVERFEISHTVTALRAAAVTSGHSACAY